MLGNTVSKKQAPYRMVEEILRDSNPPPGFYLIQRDLNTVLWSL